MEAYALDSVFGGQYCVRYNSAVSLTYMSCYALECEREREKKRERKRELDWLGMQKV